jgi:hypothetical protein
MGLIFLALGIAGALLGNQWIQIAPIVFASIYVLILGPGAFTGGRELDKNQLNSKLSENWRNSDEIADFIITYWFSIKYVMSAQRRGANCSFIGLSSLALAGWYFYSQLPAWVVAWSVINGLLLWAIGNKVNKALFILLHEQGTPQWDLACVSFVALSDIFYNEHYGYIVNSLLPPDRLEAAVSSYEKPRFPQDARSDTNDARKRDDLSSIEASQPPTATHQAPRVLKSSSMSKSSKTVGGSALSQILSKKISAKKAATTASKVLRDRKTSTANKSAARSVLSHSAAKKDRSDTGTNSGGPRTKK